MAIELATLFVSYDRVALRWALTEAAPGGVTFEVLRSGNALTGFEVVGRTRNIVYLDQVNLMGKSRPTYYKVRATIGAQEVESNVADLGAPPDDTVLRLQRRERFQLAKFDGFPAMLYSRRRSGARCPRCVGNPAQGSMGIECAMCFGTGFKGGYYPPMPLYVARQSLEQDGANLTENYVKESSTANFWTSNWAIVVPEDVLIEMTPPNRVWRVTGAQRTERRLAEIRQLLTVSEADKGSAVYRVPIPDFAFPAREEIFMFDWSEPPRDFDTLFQERLEAYVEDQDARDPDEPEAQSPGPGGAPRKRNPATGHYS